jgi:hypothetical protein
MLLRNVGVNLQSDAVSSPRRLQRVKCAPRKLGKLTLQLQTRYCRVVKELVDFEGRIVAYFGLHMFVERRRKNINQDASALAETRDGNFPNTG